MQSGGGLVIALVFRQLVGVRAELLGDLGVRLPGPVTEAAGQ